MEVIIHAKVCPSCKKEFLTEDTHCADDGEELSVLAKDPLVGTIFAEKYEILSILGTGGMSVIYKARHKYMERLCAVKLLHPFLVADDSLFQRFQYEAKAASTLSHPNIVAMHDFGITKDGRAYLVMDYLEGEDLSVVLDREVFLEEEKASPIFKQIIAGLDHAHAKGVIHRDLKPSNVFLTPHANGLLVRIVDFGIAKIKSENSNQALTRTGEVFGSPLYMSPEQCSGKELDARSDIYSLGCLMYETLSGRRPLVGESALETMNLHLKEAPLTLSQAAPKNKISRTLEAAVMKCLNKLAKDRYQSVAELDKELFQGKVSDGGLSTLPSEQKVSAVVSDVLPTPSLPAASPSSHLVFEQKSVVAEVKQRRHSLLSQLSNNRGLLLLTLALILCGLIALSGLYWVIAIWPGPESDRGTLIHRWAYTIWMSRAEQLESASHYDAAEDAYNQAEKIAVGFGDNSGRRMNVLRGKLKLFADSNQPKKSEAVLTAMARVNHDRTLADCASTMAEIDRLKKTYAQERTTNKGRGINTEREIALQMGTKIGAIIAVSQRLKAISAYDDQEDLLQKAADFYGQLVSNDDAQLADLKTNLAYSHWDQDELPYVHPLLAEALAITIRANKRDARQASMVDVGEAWLRLGQFDRDRSDFSNSEKELTEALRILRPYAKLDRNNLESVHAYKLLIESLNAMADFKMQTHKMGDAQGLRDEVAVLKKVKLDYHPEPE